MERGAYAAEVLVGAASELDERDAGLATEIVFGVLRYQAQLDHLIALFSRRPAGRLDPEVRIALRMGIYQLRYLERIPSHAAVTESVELVKRARKRSAAGLVNAVLRKVNRDPVVWPDRATALSMPAWLLERWDGYFGCEVAEGIARAFLAAPVTYVRVPPSKQPFISVPGGVTLAPTAVPGCYEVVTGKPEGLRIQDIGSQSIVPLLDLQPGQRFLDLCAAPGNKSAQAMESGVRAVACEYHLSRARMLKDLGCPVVVLDGAAPLPFSCKFDRILVDAPCSGTGTLGRNPEIKWRIQPTDLADLHARQTALLRNAVEHLAPGGRLVYSTCSLEFEENEEVVEEALSEARPEIWVELLVRRTPGIDPGDGFFAAVITSE